MKRFFLMAVAAIISMTAWAQNIAVVSPNNTTAIYQTLDDAITSAANGSTIYLPGGGFQIKDETKIDRKLTIMGVSHRGDTDNVDGATLIAGNLHFLENSSGSAVLGVYISGDVYIGDDETTVNNVIIKKCNINSIQVKNGNCSGTIVNQNYIRNNSDFHDANGTFSNNIMHSVQNVNAGVITYNIITSYYEYARWYGTLGGLNQRFCPIGANNSIISHNVLLNHRDAHCNGSENQSYNNMSKADWEGENNINIGEVDWNDVFENFNNGTISTVSDFHFKSEYKKYENKVGIYAGDGFDPDALAPIPRIVSKKVAEQTDGSGKLSIEVTVKSN